VSDPTRYQKSKKFLWNYWACVSSIRAT
jgi:hypothetical protein